MNYKCTNDECGWTGEEKDCGHFTDDRGCFRLCPKCLRTVERSKYTRVPPTEPGWYWYKDENIAKENTINKHNCGVIDRYIVQRGDGYWTIYLDEYRTETYYDSGIGELPGEWSERIEPPE